MLAAGGLTHEGMHGKQGRDKGHGVTGVKQLILRSPQDEALTAAVYKSRARAGLEKKGWKIALSLGDQVSDMSLGHADAGFLLPNPMYFIP